MATSATSVTTAARSGSMRTAWTATWLIPIAAQVVISLLFSSTTWLASPEVLFLFVCFAASLCAVTATAVIRHAFRTGEAELASVGAFFFAVSVLMLAHGITTPGVLFEANSATTFSVLIAIPVGLLAAAPFISRRTQAADWLRKYWGAWIAASVAGTTALAGALIAAPNSMPMIEARHPAAIAIGVASALGCIRLSYRHLNIARIAQRHAPLTVSVALGMVGASALVWLAAAPFDTGFWSAHSFDLIGSLLGTVGAIAVYRRSDTMERVVGPVLLTEPLTALAVGVDPIVHRFIADLDAKDSITRDHVIRTAEIAVRVGQEMRLPALRLRDLGLAAILHDVGKIGVPDKILTKPGRLTPGEYEIMQSHAEIGERMILDSPVLASIAPAIRGHHERMDGGGYPDGLVGTEISQNARIVAVCDAYDAMANSRQYRTGMGHDKAVAILREHAGSQWDPVVVEALVMTLARRPITEELHIQIDQIGREIDLAGWETSSHVGCDCLPDFAREALDAPTPS